MNDVSIIVSAFNVEDYISECIESILRQSYECFELIIVDDGSTDSTLAICNKYAKKDKRIVVLHQNNLGQSMAKNNGLRMAKYDYVCFVDGDDLIDKNFIKILRSYMTNSDISMCLYKRIMTIDEINNEFIPYNCDSISLNSDDYWFYPFKEGTDVVLWNKMFKRKLFENIEFTPGILLDDENVIHELIDKCKQITLANTSLYYYRDRTGSITNTISLLNKKITYLFILHKRVQFYLLKEKKQLANMFYVKGVDILLFQYYCRRKLYNFKPLINLYRLLLKNNKKTLYISNRHKMFLATPYLYSLLRKIYSIIRRNKY